VREEKEMSTATVLANPAKMIAKGAPHIIHSDEELEVYTEALFKLTALENPSDSEEKAIELLTMLVQQYEKEHWPISKATPVSVVRYLIEKGNLTQRDLIPEFGYGKCRCQHVPVSGATEISALNKFGNSALASNSVPTLSCPK
jgi:HTH-type transcriptional regulator/antitoxin HigA